MRRLPIVLLVLALLVAACSGGDAEIARVGDASIRLSDMQALYEAEQPLDDGFRQTLFAAIALEALTDELAARFGATIDPAAVDTYYTQFADAITQAGASAADLLGVENASLEMVRFNAEIMALRDAALDELVVDPGTVEALFADPMILTNVCVRHVLVATQEEAEAVLARLEGGEDLAVVATEVSLDTEAEGGDLGCTLAGDYVDEFAAGAMAAPLNEPTGPIETEYGFHVLLVTERTTASRAEYDADPWAVLSSGRTAMIWAEWITEVLAVADVWVAERYGTWTPDGILAPEASSTTISPFLTTTSGG